MKNYENRMSNSNFTSTRKEEKDGTKLELVIQVDPTHASVWIC